MATGLLEATGKGSRLEISIAMRTHPVMQELQEMHTLREVAEISRCSKAHVCEVINGQVAGTTRLPAVGLGRRKLVRRATLSVLPWPDRLKSMPADAQKERSEMRRRRYQ
jgi:hypothetical protein